MNFSRKEGGVLLKIGLKWLKGSGSKFSYGAGPLLNKKVGFQLCLTNIEQHPPTSSEKIIFFKDLFLF